LGNAAIYWFPDPDGAVQTIDLGSGLTELVEDPDTVIDVGESAIGGQQRLVWRNRLRVRVQLERGNHQSTAGKSINRALMSMRYHLYNGGSIGVAADTAKAWCGFSRLATAKAGDVVVYTKGDPTSGWAGGTLSSGDEICIFGMQPGPPYEWGTVSSLVGSKVNLSTGLLYNYDTIVGVRARNYFPALMLPGNATDSNVVISERRVTWTLDLDLVEDTATLEALSTSEAGSLRGTTAASGKTSPMRAVDSNRDPYSWAPKRSSVSGKS
jgi:hypothetical protein